MKYILMRLKLEFDIFCLKIALLIATKANYVLVLIGLLLILSFIPVTAHITGYVINILAILILLASQKTLYAAGSFRWYMVITSIFLITLNTVLYWVKPNWLISTLSQIFVLIILFIGKDNDDDDGKGLTRRIKSLQIELDGLKTVKGVLRGV